MFSTQRNLIKMTLELDYVRLAPGFAREVLEIYENWEGREPGPVKTWAV
jgi:hypothetical protein